MLEIKRETDYAMHLLIILSKANNQYLSLQTISEISGISFHFLQKIARKLKIKKIIKSSKGVSGGYILNHPIDKISFKQIIEAMEDKIGFTPCLIKNHQTTCVKAPNHKCPLKNKLKKINDQILEILSQTKLSDLIYDKTT